IPAMPGVPVTPRYRPSPRPLPRTRSGCAYGVVLAGVRADCRCVLGVAHRAGYGLLDAGAAQGAELHCHERPANLRDVAMTVHGHAAAGAEVVVDTGVVPDLDVVTQHLAALQQLEVARQRPPAADLRAAAAVAAAGAGREVEPGAVTHRAAVTAAAVEGRHGQPSWPCGVPARAASSLSRAFAAIAAGREACSWAKAVNAGRFSISPIIM